MKRIRKIICLIFGHKWYTMKVEDYNYEGRDTHIIHYKCTRCGVETTEWIIDNEKRFYRKKII